MSILAREDKSENKVDLLGHGGDRWAIARCHVQQWQHQWGALDQKELEICHLSTTESGYTYHKSVGWQHDCFSLKRQTN